MVSDIRHQNHWVLEDFKQVITSDQLKRLIQNENMSMIFRGKLVDLHYVKTGPGLYKIFKVFDNKCPTCGKSCKRGQNHETDIKTTCKTATT
jgi:hypothetical protein